LNLAAIRPTRTALAAEYQHVSYRQGSHPRAPLDTSDDLDRLLGAVARGEHGAFDLVYGQLRDPIRNQVFAVLRDPAQSDEVTQDVLLELWRTAVRYDPDKGSAAAWALTIARRRAVDRVRRTAAATARDQQAALPTADWDQIHDSVQDTLDRERLLRCMAQLSDLQREAIALTFYGGRTHVQAAEILGAPLGTVKARIRDALIKLRDSMHADAAGQARDASGDGRPEARDRDGDG
jgi:RNA polymerase sigma-70 factor (ECF subfamily)